MRATRWLIVFTLLLTGSFLSAQDVVRVDPANPKYLLFRDKPLLLISASEHYGSVINRPFDYEKYLADAANHKMTMTRTFLLYRELQSARNPSSPCKPESPDYIAPFERTGPGVAMDGEPMYDLDRWNPEYFDRLHRFLELASKLGIVVELTVFSNTYSNDVWSLNPFRAENNLQHVGHVEWEDYTSLKDAELVRRQSQYARKIVQETSRYDNVYYEICNEPGGGVSGHSTPAEVDAWQDYMAKAIKDEMSRLGRHHLLAGQGAFNYAEHVDLPMDTAFKSSSFDIVNDHPLPNTHLDGHTYQMGNFMSKELMLQQVKDFCLEAYHLSKPTVLDEDNAASMYRDLTGWTIHRKRSWTALMNGCHYDYIDFSITVGSESGTNASQAAIRRWMQHLAEFMSAFDTRRAQPSTAWISGYPQNLVVSGMLTPTGKYVAYLADEREVSNPLAGAKIRGSVQLSLPSGEYKVGLYSPVTGEFSPMLTMKGGAPSELVLPEFNQDIVIMVTQEKNTN